MADRLSHPLVALPPLEVTGLPPVGPTDVEAAPLAARLELFASRLAAIEQRLDRLESRRPASAAGRALFGLPDRPQTAAAAPRAGADMPDVGTVVSLLGRTLFVLAGAFLLRALTDSGRLEAGVGALIGLAFAVVWIVMADRDGGRGRDASAAFHGFAFVVIAFPLLFEATTRFHFLNPAAAAAALGGCTALALAVATRRRLQAVAWIASLAAVGTAAALALATGQLGPSALFLVLLGVAALWLGYVLEWRLLRWPIAFVADLAVLILSLRAMTPGAADTAAIAFSAQILLLVAYLGSFATRTLVLNRDVIQFEVVQSAAAAIAGLGGAAYLTHTLGGEHPLGIAILALAAGSYAAAAVFVERRQSRRRNYYFYTSAGLVLALAGAALALPRAQVGLVYALFGVVAASAGRLSRRVTYRAHGSVYLIIAFMSSGLLPYVFYGLGLPVGPGARASTLMLAVLGLSALATWGLGFEASSPAPSPGRRMPSLIVLVLLIGGALGTAVSWAVATPSSGWAAAPGMVATVRTALLVAAILALASADRIWGFVNGARLVYPLLVLTGLKFLFEDVRAGQPATLFVGFALYGLALIVGPRLRRRPAMDDGQALPRSSS